MYLQNGDTARLIGIVHRHLTVKPTRTKQRRIKNVPAVGRRHDNHALIDGKAVHFHQQLIQGLLALIMTAAQTRAAMTTHRVDLINKHDGRRGLLGLIEQIAHAACANANEHFHKVGAGNGEERHVRLARHGLSQQGLTRAGRSHQQHALWDTRTHIKIILRVAQEVYHFLKLFLFLVRTGYVGKRDLIAAGISHTGTALAEVHDLIVAAALGAHHEIPQHHEQTDSQ